MVDFHPEITPPTKLNLLGCTFYGDPFHDAKEWSYSNEIGNLWKRFMGLSKKFGFFLEKINPNPGVAYEVHFESEEYQKTKNFEVFVGIAASNFLDIPLDFVIKPLPEAQYAIFPIKMKNVAQGQYIFLDWLGTESAGYQQSYPFIIERYGKDYKGMEDPESIIDWLIPIAPIGDGNI